MAEINIERKKKPVWPWLLLLVIVALLGWVVYEFALKNEQAYLPLTPKEQSIGTATTPATRTGIIIPN
ncbi:hypothetical protein H9Q13_04750 [Pontibacter sp. JH31]|uniref:Uncharacterized protein n=1 Tax=Pontibacter aquaedesilientis TaxID=2766980 RepID=A0ABR7XDV1_9BACT|nr:hypothetical protein [Pontibacter aquaedesilientis]MBD1396464.1 hypothetical protein [Pontibacter aquaedesilientis]